MKCRYLLVSLVVALTGAACGDDDGGTTPTPDGGADMTVTPPTPPRPDTGPPPDMGPRPDMGMRPDMGRPDMAMPPSALPTCAMPQVVEGRIGLATAMVDTSGGPPGPLMLGACALDGMSSIAKAQAVIAYQVPGTGSVGIEFTTDNPGTEEGLDTMVEVRTGDCTDAAMSQCFDDIDTAGGNYLSEGTVSAMGGSTVYFVLTGFPDAEGMEMRGLNEGAMQITFTAAMNAPPTITGVTAAQAFPAMGDPTLTVTVMGGDPDGNGAGAEIELLDAAGAALDLSGDGMVDADDVIAADFDDSVDGMMTFTGVVTLTGDASEIGATQVRVRTADAFGATSAPMTGPITGLPAEFGESCDADTPCRAPSVCTGGTCQASAETAAACMAATAITLDGMGSGMSMGTLLPGTGLFSGSCGSTGGTESIFTVTIPAGMHDLVADTAVLGTDEMADTVVYIRNVCGNPRSEPAGACSDDEEDARARAAVLNAPAGTYTIFVEDFGGVDMGMMTPFAVQVRLRPVLGAGAMCDMMGLANRCSTGDCAMGTCPPAM